MTNSFSIQNTQQSEIWDLFQVCALPDSESILVFFLYRNIFQLYDYEGRLVREFSLDGIASRSEANSSISLGNIKFPSSRLISNVFIQDKENIYVLIGKNPSSEYSYQIIKRIDINGKENATFFIENPARKITIHNENIF